MNKELQQKLYDRFPELYRQHSLDMRQTAMCWGFDVDDGWFDIIWTLSLALEDETKTSGTVIEAVQVKEKFGGLRFYVGGCTERGHKLIEAAERTADHTCEVCGKSGKVTNRGGWLKTVCKEHAAELGYEWRDRRDIPDEKLNEVLDEILKQVVCDCGNFRHHGVNWMPEGSGEGLKEAREILESFVEGY